MDEKQVREFLGEKKYDEMVDYVRTLIAQGKSPDQITQGLASKYKDWLFAQIAIIFHGMK